MIIIFLVYKNVNIINIDNVNTYYNNNNIYDIRCIYIIHLYIYFINIYCIYVKNI